MVDFDVINIFITFSNSGGRNEVRKRVVMQFFKEAPGTGNKKLASRYNYFVEKLSIGKHIILTRPANLKNGFDFVIRVEGMDFNNGIGRKRDNPTHDDIFSDIIAKKEKNPRIYKKFYRLIKKIYDCEDIEPRELSKIRFSKGYPVDMVLCVIKWFFIEQDIRYWNYSGRSMFMSGIPEV